MTGGTGSIGSAICRALAEGADVAFTWHRRAAVAESLAARAFSLGRRAFAGRVDAVSSASVDSFCRDAETALGRLDILVNNVGAAQVMPFALLTEEDFDRALAVNLKGPFLFTKAVARGMVRRKAGVIVNIGSLAGRRLLEVPVPYATAKAGITGFTLSLAKEFSRYGVRVVEVVPGLIDGGVGTLVPEEQLADYRRFCATGRTGKPEEVAELVAFLASDRASYVNAESFVIDGGL